MPGALSDSVEIWNDTDKKGEAGITVAGTSGTLNGLSLNPAKSYFFQVHALGADITAPLTTPITTQFNITFERVPFTF